MTLRVEEFGSFGVGELGVWSLGGVGIPARRDLPVRTKVKLAAGKSACPGDTVELFLE